MKNVIIFLLTLAAASCGGNFASPELLTQENQLLKMTNAEKDTIILLLKENIRLKDSAIKVRDSIIVKCGGKDLLFNGPVNTVTIGN